MSRVHLANLALLAALAAAPLDAAEAPLLVAAFEDGVLPSGWRIEGGSWSVVDGALRGGALSGEGAVFFGDASWRDVAIEADVRFESTRNPSRWVALLARDGGVGAPGAQLTLRRDCVKPNGVELASKTRDGEGWRVFQTARAPRGFDEERSSCRLRLELRGDWLFGWVDGVRLLHCRRGGDVSPRGLVGFRVNGAVVRIDNVEVQRMQPLDSKAWHALRGRPLVVAHRGLSSRAPENTLVAYRMAMEVGAELAECDVHLTKDRVPVLIHDEGLARTAGLQKQVGELTLTELKALDVGRWKAPEFAGERVPTLEEALHLVKGRMRFVIEIKQDGMEKEVVAAIAAAGVDPVDVMIFAFEYEVVRIIAELEPQLPTTWLLSDPPTLEDAQREVLRKALKARASAVGVSRERVYPDFVRRAHESGFSVFVWTVNEIEDMRHLAATGVDAIITDRADVLLKELESER